MKKCLASPKWTFKGLWFEVVQKKFSKKFYAVIMILIVFLPNFEAVKMSVNVG